MGDYTIEKVYFESLPGHYVTGNLYRPAGASREIGVVDGKRPAILCPHGHWKDGRFLDQAGETRSDRMVKNAIAMGAERFVSAARSPLQARCVQLARMGCVVFHYDMLANADSVQVSSHKISPREEMNSLKKGEWGFASPAAAARLQTSFGLQTWNSVRAVDFVLRLKEVDPERVAVTGASGGGTQTMMVTAVDERVAVAFPCVMPSTAMQGGCTCENTHLLRIGQGNIDISAVTAPRPLGITTADDWTIEFETKGHLDLLNLYGMLQQSKRYEAHFDTHFKHNYNHVSRTHMYGFMSRHLGLGLEEPVLERDFEFLPGKELTVWDSEHPRPSGPEVGETHDRAVCRWMTSDAERQVRALLNPADAAAVEQTRKVLGGALEVLIGRGAPDADLLEHELVEKAERDGVVEMSGIFRHAGEGEEVPAVSLYPSNWAKKVAIWVHPEGKSGLYDGDGSFSLEVRRLLDAGHAVVGVDLLGQGEHRDAEGKIDWSRNRDVSAGKEIRAGQEWRRSSLYTYGYNNALFAQRVHDIMTVSAFVAASEKWEPEELVVIGAQGAGHWVAAAKAVMGEGIDRVAADLNGFRFAELEDAMDEDFLPGAVKYGDVAGLLALAAPGELWVAGADKRSVTVVENAYGALGKGKKATVHAGNPKGRAAAAVDWVLR
jgi:cephalosporin-C deacetylase-like acetyl esterase